MGSLGGGVMGGEDIVEHKTCEIWVAPVNQCFLKEKQHAIRAGTDGYTCKMGKVTQ